MNLLSLSPRHDYWKYDPDRTRVSPCGTVHAIFVGGGKKPKIFRVRLVEADDYTKAVGWVTFSNQRHNLRLGSRYATGYNTGHVKNLTETGDALVDRLFKILEAFKS